MITDIAEIEIYYDVEKAIDYAFEGKFVLNFYDYLKVKNIKKPQIQKFIESNVVTNLKETIKSLDEYLLPIKYQYLENHPTLQVLCSTQ